VVKRELDEDVRTVNLGVLEEIIANSYRTLTSGTHRHRAVESHCGRPE
jgi:hypothetical protein